MKGLLVVNQFVSAKKFTELYSMLLQAAKQFDVALSVKRTGEIPHNLDSVRSVESDFVLFWDKDVVLAEMLELCGISVFNSASAVYYCDNKAYTAMRLQQANVRIPETYIAPLTFEGLGYTDLGFAEQIIEKLGYPFIVKELYGSFGQQVYLVSDLQELKDVTDKIGYKGFLLQKFIESSRGKDVRVNVVGNEVVSSMMRYSINGDFRSNISNGGQMKKYEISREQSEAAILACRALGLDFAGVDILFGPEGEPIVCEVNSNPHFKSTLECTGKDMSYEIMRYVRDRMGAL